MDPLSAWSRKLQVFVLGYASVTVLLSSGLVATIDVNSPGGEASGLPAAVAARLAALVTLGGLLFYWVSCYQDWTLHKLPSEYSIKKILSSASVYAMEAFDTSTAASEAHLQEVKRSQDNARLDSEDNRRLASLLQKSANCTITMWEEKEIEERAKRMLASEDLTTSQAKETDVLRRRSKALREAAQSLAALLEQYQTHQGLRVRFEIIAPSLFAFLAAWLALT